MKKRLRLSHGAFLFFFINMGIGASLHATDWYSYTGNGTGGTPWNNASFWTQDPSGATLIPTGGGIPSDGDNVYILNGMVVHTSGVDITTNLNILSILSGGTLDIGSNSIGTIGTLSGTGKLMISRSYYPTVTTDLFNVSNGGTVEYYSFGGIPITLPAQTTYNNLIISNSTNAAWGITFPNGTNPTTYTILGNLTLVKTGNASVYLRLGNAATNVINMNISGNLNVGLGCTLDVGVFNAIHALSIGGDLVNNGTVTLTNNLTALYNQTSTTGAATVTFTGTSNNVLTCNGPTDFYKITLNKGTNQSPTLTVSSGSSSYFNVRGPNASPGAIVLTNGTLRLQGQINLPSLVESSTFVIPATACFWVDGAGVSVAMQAAAGPRGITLTGKLRISAGTLYEGTGAQRGITTGSTGDLVVEGGTLSMPDIKPNGVVTTSTTTYYQSGGVVNINSNNTANQNFYARFCYPFSANAFTMTGGTLNVYNPTTGSGAGVANGGGILIGCASSNISVTGGDVNAYTPNTSVNFAINSTAPFYNFTIHRTGTSGTGVAILDTIWTTSGTAPTRPFYYPNKLVVLNDLTVSATNSPTFSANSQDVYVGGDFIIASGATYVPGNNNTEFNGNASQQLVLDGSVTNHFNQLTVNKTSGVLTLSGSGSVLVRKLLKLSNGVLDDAGKVITVNGNVDNSATHTGSGSIVLTNTGLTDIRITNSGSSYGPTVTGPGGGTGAVFYTKIIDGIIKELRVVSGGNGYGGTTITIGNAGGGGAGASATCEVSGGAIASVHLATGGSGYGPVLSMSGGTGSGGTASVTVEGTTTNTSSNAVVTAIHITNAGSYSAAPSVLLSGGGGTGGTATAYITHTMSGSGNGTFGNLTLNNSNGAVLSANQTVSSVVTLSGSSGILDISSYNLSVTSVSGSSIVSTGGAFGSSKMIRTGGSRSDGGLTVTYNASKGDFIFPVGASGKYTPVTIHATTTGNYGTINVTPVNATHPNVTSAGQSLKYYWKVASSGWSGILTVQHKQYTYASGDLQGSLTNYTPSRYDQNSFTWSHGSTYDASIPPGSTTIPDFSTGGFSGITPPSTDYIDGEYTVGEPTAFGSVTVYYCRQSGVWNTFSGGLYTTWSTIGHTGPASSSLPGTSSPVVIGDGASNNRTVSITTNSIVVGSLQINSGSTLDIGATTGHDFGALNSPVLGSGTLRISSGVSTAQFPAGDFSSFLSSYGGTVEYYYTTSAFTLPLTSQSGLSLNSYKKLVITPGSFGQDITMPNTDLTVWGDMTCQSSGVGFTNLNAQSAKTLTVSGDLNVTGGYFNFANGTPQTLIVNGDLQVSLGATFQANAAVGAIVANTMMLYGNMNIDGTVNLSQTKYCDVTFVGTGNQFVQGTGTVVFNRLIVNKGTNQTAVLDLGVTNLSINATSAGTSKAIDLQNGTLKLSNGSTITLSSGLNNGANFTIPASACLWINNGTARVTATGTNAGVNLDGKLKITGTGVVDILGASTADNFIAYSASGYSAIDVSGGTLTVGSQIRRASGSAFLQYSQSGGTVTVGVHQAPNGSNGVFEVLNAGSAFTFSGGTLVLTRAQTSPTVQSLYLTPSTSNVTGGTIQCGHSSTPSSSVMTIYSTIPIYHLDINNASSNNPTVRLQNSSLNISGNLTVSSGCTFDANSLNILIGGNLTNTGMFTAGSQTTTFNSSYQNQVVTGNITFSNLTINNTFSSGSVTIANGSAIVVNGTLHIASGVLADGGNTITAKGTVLNASVHSGLGTLLLNGTTQQTLSGTGTYGNIAINNSAGIIASTNIVISGTLTFQAGMFDMGANLLTLSNTADNIVTGTSAGQYIRTGGALSDAGIIKYFQSGSSDFTFPVGVSGKYTPVRFTISSSASSGDITVKPVNVVHPGTTDPGNTALSYYWNIVSTGFTNPVLTHQYTYAAADVHATESNYVGGRLTASGWTPQGGIVGAVDDVLHTITLSNVNYIDGEYTAGYSAEFGTVKTYYSRNATSGGNWDDPNAWTLSSDGSGSGDGAYPISSTRLVVLGGHTIAANGNNRACLSLTLNNGGTLDLGNTSGHNLGAISGNGTMKVGSNMILPVGDWSSFVASSGGTIEYTAAGTMPIRSVYCHLSFTGNSVKTIPNLDLTINGDLSILAGSLNNSSNKQITATGSFSNAGTLNLNNGVLNLTGTLNNTGTLNAGSATINAGTISNAGSVSLSSGTAVTTATSLTNTAGTFALGGASLSVGTHFIHSGGTFTVSTGTVLVSGNFTNTASFDAGSGTVTILGTYTNSGSGVYNATSSVLHVQSSFTNAAVYHANSATIRLYGDWYNNVGTFNAGTDTLVVCGSTPQTISGPTTFSNLRIANSSGVSLASDVAVSNVLIFTQGTLQTSGFLVHLTNTVSQPVLAYSSSSFVDGRLEINFPNTSNVTRIFPVGNAGKYRPVTIEQQAVSASPVVEVAMFQTATPNLTPITGGTRAASLDIISPARYYQIYLKSGTMNAPRITLEFNTNSADENVMTPGNLRVARATDPQGPWTDEGGSGVFSPADPSGYVTSGTTSLSTASLFAIASASTDNTLPVELSMCKAFHEGNYVDVTWETESEVENAYWLLQRVEIQNENHSAIAPGQYEIIHTAIGQGTKSSVTQYAYRDDNVDPGKTYMYRLADVNYDGVVTYHLGFKAVSVVPTKTKLLQNFPNPFNPTTTIPFELSEDSNVRLVIYNILGQTVAVLTHEFLSKGRYQKLWDGRTMRGDAASSGVYIYRLEVNNRKSVQRFSGKMYLIK